MMEVRPDVGDGTAERPIACKVQGKVGRDPPGSVGGAVLQDLREIKDIVV